MNNGNNGLYIIDTQMQTAMRILYKITASIINNSFNNQETGLIHCALDNNRYLNKESIMKMGNYSIIISEYI